MNTSFATVTGKKKQKQKKQLNNTLHEYAKKRKFTPNLHRVGFTASAFSHPEKKNDIDGWKVKKRENDKQCN